MRKGAEEEDTPPPCTHAPVYGAARGQPLEPSSGPPREPWGMGLPMGPAPGTLAKPPWGHLGPP
eukprot:2230830-Pyramimonas_sp.AAC.1